jgi:uncharacterized protein involved in propanediol utilization
MEKVDYFSHVHSDSFKSCLTVGGGVAIGHHGEIFQGVYADGSDQLRRGLVSLMSGAFRAEAFFYTNFSGTVSVEPAWKVKAARASELTLEYCNAPLRGGHLIIKNNIPSAWGLGSSTRDVTAAIRAVGDAFGHTLSPQVVADLAVRAEIASDPVMFSDRAVLFAQREGVVLEDFSRHLPPREVLGFNTDPDGYDTLGAPPARYSWWEIEAFRPLIGLLRKAVDTQDPNLVGYVASASARINQRHLPKPHFNELEVLTKQVGAVGLQVAHSGTVVGLLFDPAEINAEDRIAKARKHLAEIGITLTWRLSSKTEYDSEKTGVAFTPFGDENWEQNSSPSHIAGSECGDVEFGSELALITGTAQLNPTAELVGRFRT